MPDDPKIDAERITIYDSVHIPPGEKVPERITFYSVRMGSSVW